MGRIRFAATLTVVLATVALPSIVLYHVVAKICRHRKERLSDEIIVVVSDPENPKFEIVAVHGLGAHPVHTWCKAPDKPPAEPAQACEAPAKSVAACDKGHIHLLGDLLKRDFPEARILSFAYNADWLIDGPVTSIPQIGDKLLEQLRSDRSSRPRIPIIFIGHSFGGIIIKEAVRKASNDSLVEDTCGIIFLGTPHQGSPAFIRGAIVAFFTKFLGSDATLLLALRDQGTELSNLEDDFVKCMKQKEHWGQKTQIISFYEKRRTFLLGLFPIGLVVTRESARGGHAPEPIGIDTDHSGLNKCSQREREPYRTLRQKLESLRPTAKPTLNTVQQYVWERLDPVKGAAFDEGTSEERDRCHPETRVGLLKEIDDWAHDNEDQHIYWLQGMAGTGKSAISRTVADKFNAAGLLGASFFFRRGEGDRSKGTRFFTTIAAQLVRQFPPMAEHVRYEIGAEPSITEKSINVQFETLVLEPLSKVKGNSHTSSKTMMVVVDALDECDCEAEIRLIINNLSQAKHFSSIRLKFFLTSRPNVPIVREFSQIAGQCRHRRLHNVEDHIIERDTAVFLHSKLTEIRKDYNIFPIGQDLSADWPAEADVQRLAKMAVPLFIFAATACLFIKNGKPGNPKEKLKKVLEQKTGSQPSKLHDMYRFVLEQLLDNLTISREELIDEFREIVGAIVMLVEPLSTACLAQLLNVTEEKIYNMVGHLPSVLNIPSSRDNPVRTLHLSFRDFLVDPKGAEDFWVDEKRTHEMLADRCIQLMSTSLKRNICDRKTPGALAAEIGSSQIEKYLPLEVQYACLYWVQHLQKSGIQHQDNNQVHQFLQKHLLHWLEALGWMRRLYKGIHAITLLEALTHASKCLDLQAFVQDVKRFALSSRELIEQAPLQAYCSALIFAPARSKVKNQFRDIILRWMETFPKVEENWNALLQTLKGHSDWVCSVAFSPDSARLASASYCQGWALSSDNEWITCNSENWVLLPSEYRPSRSAVSGNTIGIGVGTGKVWICSFKVANVQDAWKLFLSR